MSLSRVQKLSLVKSKFLSSCREVSEQEVKLLRNLTLFGRYFSDAC